MKSLEGMVLREKESLLLLVCLLLEISRSLSKTAAPCRFMQILTDTSVHNQHILDEALGSGRPVITIMNHDSTMDGKSVLH